jgi:hypothetical protein
MAIKTYTVTVASGNLYGGGTGNVFYLDGARNSTGPGTVSWVAGATLRFDQSASSNDGHPLIFSSNTSTGGIISSGVTYYLDGSSNQTNYTNTTTFNAATTRYIEITPSSEVDFYYLCYVHGIGMGGIMDMTQNTWGALTWGLNEWGDQADTVFSVTGLSATLSQGATIEPTAEINEGWGRLTWGENAWGVSGDIIALGQSMTASIGAAVANFGSSDTATGQSITSAVGSVSIEIATQPIASGQSLTSTTGQVVAGGEATVPVTGSSISSNVGAATIDPDFLIGQGWGRGTWGNRVWGGNYSVIASGQSLSSSIGAVTINVSDGILAGSLNLLTITQGLESLKIDGDVTVFASEDQLDLSLGNQSLEQSTNESVTGQSITSSLGTVVPEPKIPVDVSGISATLSLGTISLEQTTVESVTGQLATFAQGAVDPVAIYPVTTAGSLASSIGSVSVVGTAGVIVSGIGLTANIGSVNVTAWEEIDPGVNNVWTEVDRAA